MSLAPLSVTKKDAAPLEEQLSSALPCASGAAPAGSETVQRSFGTFVLAQENRARKHRAV